ncbi:unnamed protein product, partial [Leptidea sinapis]
MEYMLRHFDKSEWCEVSPGFTQLEANEEIRHYDSQRHLAYADKSYAALTLYLLKQREVLQDNMTNLITWAHDKVGLTSEQLRVKITELFSEGEHQRVSSDMLQIICGHRAETIHMRRYVVINFVRDPLLKSTLRKIPPSNQHIFNAEMLASALETAGGVPTRYPSQGPAKFDVPSQGAPQTEN